MDAEEIVATLEREASARNVAGMARFGIVGERAYGVPMVRLRQLAKQAGSRDRALARRLWRHGALETRILAALLDEPEQLTPAAAERYLRGFDSWAVTDAFAMNLFDRTPWAYGKAAEWAGREGEFQKRAGFALMAALASHDKGAPDSAFLAFLPLIEREAGDPRNFVKKGVSWALRGIGKRNARLRRSAFACAKRLREEDAPSARWIGADALRDLRTKRSLPREKGQDPRRRPPRG